jgi:cysteine sulfinate desulfinase/cysteine desulfurase-like protein
MTSRPIIEAAKALHRSTTENLAEALGREEAARLRNERWDDLHPDAQRRMIEMAQATVDAHRDASGMTG